MGKQWVKVIAAVLVLLLVCAGSVLAQDDGAGEFTVYFSRNLWHVQGDDATLYGYCGTAFSGEDHNSPLNVSPDGTQFVYLTLPEGHHISGASPTNVKLCDMETQTETRVRSQPEGASLDPMHEDFFYYVRSQPAWSPDGERLAWTLLSGPPAVGFLKLVVYEIAGDRHSWIVNDFPPQVFIPRALDVIWIQAGIVVLENAFAESAVALYSVTGEELNRFPLPMEAGRGVVDEMLRVEDAGHELIALVYESGLVDVLDPASGERRELDGQLQLYAPGTPADSLVMNYNPAAEDGRMWAIVTPGGEVIEIEYTERLPELSVAIATDGQSVALAGVQVQVWRAGEWTTLPIPYISASAYKGISVAGAPQAWRVVVD
ncbi:MAG: hypothetical protein K8S97_04565 [Anaerolineae bacterium]|nr:hypothetical protein [Anaerolineae bacterium]